MEAPKAQHAWRTASYNQISVSLLLLGAVIFTLVWGSGYLARRRLKEPNLLRRGQEQTKSVGRQFGEWLPSSFRRPAAKPYPQWSLESTKPLPYRPFRYGPKYNVTMGLRSMEWDDWIELDNHFPRFHADKARRIVERGSKCSRTAPSAYGAALELLEELCAYLPERYPTLYESLGTDKIRGTSKGVRNLWSGETIEVTLRAEECKEDPIQTAGRLIQDDLAIMIEGQDGQYYLKAGSILLAGFWRLEDKFEMPLSQIHTSGDVPQFEKIERGMMNLFKRLKPEAPVIRHNYFIQCDDNLPWSTSIGSEDAKTEGNTAKAGWILAEKNKAIESHFFRSERQTLRRLPRSGGIVFTIRTYFHPIVEVAEEPYVPGRLASAIRSWGDDVSRYKGKEKYREVLLEYLDRKHEDQVANGLDLSVEEDVRAYPY